MIKNAKGVNALTSLEKIRTASGTVTTSPPLTIDPEDSTASSALLLSKFPFITVRYYKDMKRPPWLHQISKNLSLPSLNPNTLTEIENVLGTLGQTNLDDFQKKLVRFINNTNLTQDEEAVRDDELPQMTDVMIYIFLQDIETRLSNRSPPLNDTERNEIMKTIIAFSEQDTVSTCSSDILKTKALSENAFPPSPIRREWQIHIPETGPISLELTVDFKGCQEIPYAVRSSVSLKLDTDSDANRFKITMQKLEHEIEPAPTTYPILAD